MGKSCTHSNGSRVAATAIMANEPTVNSVACFTLILPAGIERSLVLGFRASIFASINRFRVIEAARAPANAAIVQNTVEADGHAGDASNNPDSANGNANTVCSSLIISDHSLNSPLAGGLTDSVALFILSVV